MKKQYRFTVAHNPLTAIIVFPIWRLYDFVCTARSSIFKRLTKGSTSNNFQLFGWRSATTGLRLFGESAVYIYILCQTGPISNKAAQLTLVIVAVVCLTD
jgi:hypothetical protein